MPEWQSITVIEEDWNRVNVEEERTARRNKDELEAVPSGSQLLLTQEPFVVELPTPVASVVHDAQKHKLEVLQNV